MRGQPRHQSLWHVLPIIGFIVSEWQFWRVEQAVPCFRLTPMPQDASDLPPYPIDMWPMLDWPLGTLDEVGVLYTAATETFSATYHPTDIAQYALVHWNAYLTTRDEKHRQTFMVQANWLVEHETCLANDMGGWPLSFPNDDYYAPAPWLSALTQGEGISVLVRAYRLTGEDIFLQVARRAIRTFELDIRDGGVSASIGGEGIFFEEVAVYPAAHILNGYLLALFGLYDYVALTDDRRIAALIQRSLATLHMLIDDFDMGYWSCYDLLFRKLAPQFYHDLHIILLQALARYSGCEHCAALAARWAGYQNSRICRLQHFIAIRIARYRSGLRYLGIRGAFLHILRGEEQTATALKSARIPIIAPPIAHHESVDGGVNR